ncbi:hypothetical protein DICPUDRAFT_148141 [Dictyostelium purpureum]|uniref:Uncharacterized protein n=1 Tax=Dictyostelium purpureum TaxID=5786 RepID=F0ZAD1_DICPU|nr:uncharacterized protein DICPUDRAFT_148141 [Dictyostelium purpureum]EGC39102.1 hypothetical protein DICPUDRAFT_148141 [Dictyostelium purpureum]|eukprot:XP_003284354.1 hypothetical protein DICPUDRAFT_148141 [Dictyostelium purpureum]
MVTNQKLNCEVIELGLVSKYFFKAVSNSLSSVLNFNNYYVLYPLIKYSAFSLIKFENSVIIFKSKFHYENYMKINQDTKKTNFRKVLVNFEENETYDTSSTVNFLLSDQQYPDNVEFNITLSIYPNDSFHNHTISEYLSGKKKINQIKLIGNFGENFRNVDILEKIGQLEPKTIIYTPNEPTRIEEDRVDVDFSKLFQCSSLKHFQTQYFYGEVGNIGKISNYPSTILKSIDVPIRFEYLKDVFNGRDIMLREPNAVVEEWNSFISALSQPNSTIKRFSLCQDIYFSSTKLVKKFDERTLTNYRSINDGLSSIFSKPTCSIETLEIKNIFFLNNDALSSLAKNTSIKTLFLSPLVFESVISKIFPLNNTIRNLILDVKEADIKFIELLSNTTSLHSFTINIISDNEGLFIEFFNNLLNNLQNNTLKIHINEINVYIQFFKPACFTSKYSINNTLLNIVENIRL